MKEHTMRPTPRRPNADLLPITLRVADACRITGIGRSKFYELIKAGEIGVIKVGAITLVPMTSIDALLARGCPGTEKCAQRALAESMHPFLANAILTASIAGTSEAVRLDLASKDQAARTQAENIIVDRMIAVLYDTHDETLVRTVTEDLRPCTQTSSTRKTLAPSVRVQDATRHRASSSRRLVNNSKV
jgi:excisionase family DNA binding protein